MTAIPLKFTNVKFFGWHQRNIGPDLRDLSDKTLQDIGLKLDRRDLNAVKPFWMA
jgi:uncharacterized protein YjiS (DUF1127 family)